MSSKTIVAIGGSGTHAAIAFLRLAILSNMNITQVPNVIVVDGDVSPGGKDSENVSPSLLDIARKLHTQVVDGCQEKVRPFFKHVTPYIGESQSQQTVQANTAFGDYLIGQSVSTAPPADKMILDALFTRKNRNIEQKSEQEIPISRGFFARPSVGATAIYDLLNQSQSELQRILTTHLGLAACRIVVVGSSTGGTGSGGGPAIAQWLMAERRARKSSAKVALFMTLPWFVSGENADTSVKEATYGDERTQRRNSAAGVRLYAESETLLEAGVFLADYNGHQHVRNDDGNYGQPEYPHVFNLMVASQIQNFFLAAETEEKKGVVGNYTFFHPCQSDRTKLVIHAADSALIAFSASRKQRQDIQDWAYETQSIRLVMEKLAAFIENDYKVATSNSTYDRKPRFAEFMLELAKSMGPEAGTTEFVGGFFKFGQRQRESAEIRHALAKSLRDRSASLAATIAWLDELRRNSDTGEASFIISEPGVRKRVDTNSYTDYPIFKPRSNGNIFVTVLSVFEDAFDEIKTKESDFPASQVLQLFQDFIDSDGGGLLPLEAATMVMEAQIRALIQLQFGGFKRRANDAEIWVAGQKIPMPLLPMRIPTEAINHYLVAFSLPKLVDEGEDRSLRHKAIADPAHPFTITDLSPGNVPSPWAAAKLQGWLHKYGSPTQKVFALARFESITWAIFTKHLVLRKISLHDARLGKLLTRSLDAEFNSPVLRHLESLLVACDANSPEDVVAVNHPLVGWYLAPWLSAEEAQSGKKGWWQMPRFNLALPSEIVRQSEHGAASFQKRQVKSYINYLSKLVQHHKPDTHNAQMVPWYDAALTLKQGMDEELKGVEPVPVETVAEFQLNLWGRQDLGSGVKWDVNKVPVVLLVQSAVDVLNGYLPDYILLLDSKKDQPLVPDSPILPEYIGKVKAKFLQLDTSENEEFPYQVSYELDIEDLGVHKVSLPAKVELFRTHVVIWPNFIEKDWAYYYIGCDPSDTIEIKDSVRFSIYSANGALLGDKSHRSFRTNHEVEGVPAFIAIENSHGDSIESRGLFAIKLEELHEADNIFQMGLDIGTSHSSLFVVNTNGARIAGLDFSSAVKLGHVIFEDSNGARRMENELRFLGMFAAKEQLANQTVLPSELRVHRRIGEPLSAAMLNHKPDPGKHFSILPLAYKSAAAISRSKGEEILSDFKWKPQKLWTGKGQHGLSGKPFEAHQEKILNLYMQQFLRIGFALIRKQGFKRLQIFRATYPEAFDRLTVDRYAEQLAQLMESLKASTGVKLEVTKPLTKENLLAYRDDPKRGVTAEDSFLLSESIAAIGAANSSVANPLWVPGVCLVLDMGGGTTDVALYATAQKGSDPVQVASLTDSIRYAGNDILGILAIPAILKVLIHANDPEITDEKISLMKPEECIITLKRAIRDGNAASALKMAFSNGDFGAEISTAIELFFQGLIDYAGLLLKPYLNKFTVEERKITVSVILLGNGWQLSDLIWPQNSDSAGGFMDVMTKQLKKQIGKLGAVSVTYNTKEAISVKESIAMGAVSFVPGGTLVAQMNPLLSVPGFSMEVNVKGCLQKFGLGEFMEFECKPAEMVDQFEIESINVLSDEMKKYLASSLEVELDDLDERLKMHLKAQIGKYINVQLHVKSPLRISPLAIFLEGLWKDVVVKVAERRIN